MIYRKIQKQKKTFFFKCRNVSLENADVILHNIHVIVTSHRHLSTKELKRKVSTTTSASIKKEIKDFYSSQNGN